MNYKEFWRPYVSQKLRKMVTKKARKEDMTITEMLAKIIEEYCG